MKFYSKLSVILIPSSFIMPSTGFSKSVNQAAGIIIKLKDSHISAKRSEGKEKSKRDIVMDFVADKANSSVKFRLFNDGIKIKHKGYTAFGWDVIDFEDNDYGSLAELVKDLGEDSDIELVDLNVIHYPTRALVGACHTYSQEVV